MQTVFDVTTFRDTTSSVLLWDVRNTSLKKLPSDLPSSISFIPTLLPGSEPVVKVYSPPSSPVHRFTARIIEVDENDANTLIKLYGATSTTVLSTRFFKSIPSLCV